jgi:hypothetical protein
VAKLNPSASGTPSLVYSTYLGGSSGDAGEGIALDASGDAYVTGVTGSTDFPTTAGAFQPIKPGSSGADNAFVTKVNPTGSALVYSTYLGGSSYDEGFGIAVDASGDAYVTGSTGSTNFPTTAGAFQTTLSGIYGSVFVTELNPSGSALAYSTYLGDGGDLSWNGNAGEGIALDASGNAYVTGFARTRGRNHNRKSGAGARAGFETFPGRLSRDQRKSYTAADRGV